MGTDSHGHGSAHGAGHAQQLNHETTDVTLSGITRVGVASLVVLALTLALVYGMYRAFMWNAADTRELTPLSAYTPGADRIPSGAALLQPDEPSLLRQFRADEQKVLRNYGWVDKNQGIVRIPIAKAMELIVAKPELAGATAPPAAAAAPGTAAPAPGATAPAAVPAAATPPAKGH